MKLIDDKEFEQDKCRLLGSFILFTKMFYLERTGRTFDISCPIGRESHYLIISAALTKVMRGEIKKLIINVPPRHGKAIDINSMILTRQGWASAADIKIGDEIIGSEGFTKVTGVYPQGILPAKEVIFSDNQTIICNAGHLWNVCDRYTATWKTLTTEQIENTLYEADGRKHWRIPLINGDYGNYQTFIDPYLLGCWLGDGHTHYAAITSMDEEIIQSFRDAGYEMRLHTHQSAGRAKTYGILGFSKILRTNNLLKNKHIPDDCYLWNPLDRLSLLQGLMDTDGTCGKLGQVSFTNTNKNIIDGVAYLVNSLGGIYRIYTRRCGTQTLNIRLPDDIPPFRLKRKQQYVSSGIKCSPRRFIENIIDVEPREMVCFTVDADDKLYAVGEGLVLTHNTELLIHFIAWTLARFPDSNYLYVSYSHSLAKKQTQTIRNIINLPMYKHLFGVEIKDDTSAKDNFETTSGGSVYAAGAGGSITGRGAGIFGMDSNRFGGCIVIDDIHKPDEVTSDTIREGVKDWYYNTLQSRINSTNTPIVFIGQRLHEDDLAANLIATNEWETIILPAIDEAGNAINPDMHDIKTLRKMQEDSPYHFASQYQQDPQPSGGGIFKRDWFPLHEFEPKILTTFVTVDTAETNKDYNDATVFSFFGCYQLTIRSVDTGLYALHMLDCLSLHIEPKDLENEFLQFYASCMLHKVKPRLVAIEKKSTGVTLASILKQYQGMQIIDITRTRASGSKTSRFLEIQSFIAKGQLSLPKEGKHTEHVLEHMRKITANNTHRFDDIADTIYDAIKLALIDNVVIGRDTGRSDHARMGQIIYSDTKYIDRLRQSAFKK